jgi:hypothetical protein
MYGFDLTENDAYERCSRHVCMLDLKPSIVFSAVKNLINI